MAPEVLRCERYDERADVYRLVFGDKPLADGSHSAKAAIDSLAKHDSQASFV